MPTTLLLPAILALFAGAFTALQPPTNAMLARAGGSVIFAALLSFAVGTAVLAFATLATQPRIGFAALRAVPWYAWAGGFYGAFFVAALAFAAPRLGVASAITIAVAGQIVAALLVDRYGLFGVPRVDVSVGRIAGAVLVLTGVVLVRRG